MTRSSLRERFERLGPVRDVPRVPSGSSVAVVLRPAADKARIKAVAATMALAKRGLSLLRAKRTVESLLEQEEIAVCLPTVEDVRALARELRSAGVKTTRMTDTTVDVKAMRLRLGMSQEQFALRFALDLSAVANWEQGRRAPDPAALAYLRVIARLPKEAASAQEEEPG